MLAAQVAVGVRHLFQGSESRLQLADFSSTCRLRGRLNLPFRIKWSTKSHAMRRPQAIPSDMRTVSPERFLFLLLKHQPLPSSRTAG